MSYNDDICEQFNEGDYRITIFNDIDSPANPREWSNLSIMEFAHGRYTLGDEQIDIDMFDSWSEIEADIIARGGKHVLPVSMYEHGGRDLSIGVMRGWDSGVIGFIYTTDAKIAEIGTPEDKIDEVLANELAEYNAYIEGEVYGYCIEKIKTCPHCGETKYEDFYQISGYYGDDGYDYCKDEAISMAKRLMGNDKE